MKKGDIIGILLLAFVIGCRYHTPLADFYAERCYPVISAGLSLLASAIPVSLEEVVVICFVVAFLVVLISAIHKKAGFFRWLWNTARVAMWVVVWLYLGWGINYFRTPLYPRMGIERASYDEEAFSRFLTEYTDALNDLSEKTVAWVREDLETDIKSFYSNTVSGYGYSVLRPWQHVKDPLLNPLYSAVGVLGFMGPFFCESQLNLDLSAVEQPSTMAHELAHLSGVTSEAEANYWAYTYCRQSENPSVRYSGYLALLPYVASSARGFLTEDQYAQWTSSLSETALGDYDKNRKYWESKRVKIIDDIQHWMMDSFLKSNGVTEGAKDYYGVIGIIMTMDKDSFKERVKDSSRDNDTDNPQEFYI